MAPKSKKSIEAIAKALVEKNPEIGTIVEDNKGGSYKALEPRITARLCVSIGKAENQFIKRNELIWACINECDGTTKEEDFSY